MLVLCYSQTKYLFNSMRPWHDCYPLIQIIAIQNECVTHLKSEKIWTMNYFLKTWLSISLSSSSCEYIQESHLFLFQSTWFGWLLSSKGCRFLHLLTTASSLSKESVTNTGIHLHSYPLSHLKKPPFVLRILLTCWIYIEYPILSALHGRMCARPVFYRDTRVWTESGRTIGRPAFLRCSDFLFL